MKTPPLIVEDVTRHLRNEIASGKLKEGEKITERSLQKKWGISRSPIREALRILEQEGLVTIFPRRGAFVSNITINELQDTIIVLATLEGLAARLALVHIADKDFKKLEQLLDKMAEEVKVFAVKEFTQTHYEFHRAFVIPCRNTLLIDLNAKLRRRHAMPKVTSYVFIRNMAVMIETHLKIIEAMKEGNPVVVERVVKDHLLTAFDYSENVEDLEIGGQIDVKYLQRM